MPRACKTNVNADCPFPVSCSVGPCLREQEIERLGNIRRLRPPVDQRPTVRPGGLFTAPSPPLAPQPELRGLANIIDHTENLGGVSMPDEPRGYAYAVVVNEEILANGPSVEAAIEIALARGVVKVAQITDGQVEVYRYIGRAKLSIDLSDTE